MKTTARRNNRLYTIAIILLLFILISMIAPTILRAMFPIPHFEAVEEYAGENHVKITLIYAMMKTESGFRETVRSPKGAIGLMQITEKTGNWIASKLSVTDFTIEQLEDPAVNIRFGCWYLSYLLERFNGNTELALAAYNAGEGTVSSWIRSGDIVWDELQIRSVPFKETEEYLTRVNRIYFIYKTLYPDLDSW